MNLCPYMPLRFGGHLLLQHNLAKLTGTPLRKAACMPDNPTGNSSTPQKFQLACLCPTLVFTEAKAHQALEKNLQWEGRRPTQREKEVE